MFLKQNKKTQKGYLSANRTFYPHVRKLLNHRLQRANQAQVSFSETKSLIKDYQIMGLLFLSEV